MQLSLNLHYGRKAIAKHLASGVKLTSNVSPGSRPGIHGGTQAD